jgi:hypothetical protein
LDSEFILGFNIITAPLLNRLGRRILLNLS